MSSNSYFRIIRNLQFIKTRKNVERYRAKKEDLPGRSISGSTKLQRRAPKFSDLQSIHLLASLDSHVHPIQDVVEFVSTLEPVGCYMDHKYHMVSPNAYHFQGCSTNDKLNMEILMSHSYISSHPKLEHDKVDTTRDCSACTSS